MERTMSVEEKIRRAEQIYERRKQGSDKQIATVSVNNEKKDIRLLKKMIVQILICISIYLVIYFINNSEYVFSKDFINKINEILSYDVNFMDLYNTIKDQYNKIIVNNNEQEQPEQTKEQEENTTQDGIGGAVEDLQNTSDVKEETTKELSQSEQDIINVKNTTTFIKPIEGIISSKYGQRDTATGRVPKNHTGTDIAANLGTKIKSATDGEVVLASEEGDYGKHLKIQIGEVSIIYAHCNILYVKQGDKVTQGQEIAEVGSTGNSTGPHLHFEIRISERTVDPQSILEL
ncbi:MAG TPA: M23 family metallopeptidase [Clostridiaceae bacterium]|jgi:murein DD-endopeptidase MepM/ murein hydrolase activator NlpD|nr:M23 family metallopeptidase [Clostridia bacterium]HJJ19323.1 M23 family metallopeptidase [Clostridiaceae bacterium]